MEWVLYFNQNAGRWAVCFIHLCTLFSNRLVDREWLIRPKMNPPLELRPLRVEDERSFKSAVKGFAEQTPPWQFAFHFDPSGDFSEYVRKLSAWSRGFELPEGFVPNSYYVGVVDAAIIGRVSIRHELNEFLRRVP